jgi:hypothetical protein
MGEMKRAESRYRAEYAMKQDRFASTLIIAAAIIAAVRLAREPDVSKPSPRGTGADLSVRGYEGMACESVEGQWA